MRLGFGWLLVSVFIVFLLLVSVQIVFSGTVFSLNATFNVTPDLILLNWTNGYRANISIAASLNQTPTEVNIANGTYDGLTLVNGSVLYANYSQIQTSSAANCVQVSLVILTYNGSTIRYNNTINITSGEITNVTLYAPQTSSISTTQCQPGRYWTSTFTIRNATVTFYNNSLNISVGLDIPISNNNTLSNLTGIGTFGGSMPINATTYHSYYFNTSGYDTVNNATGVTINMTSAQDIDLFLFDDNGVLKAKSINKTHNNEILIYSFFTTPSRVWEIRVFGNSTSTINYNGTITFTTLNATNPNSLNAPMNLSLGEFNATSQSLVFSQRNMTLRNEGELNLSNVVEYKELYLVRRFVSAGTVNSTNFTFMVPDSTIATKVKIVLNWTGKSNYTFNLYYPNDTLVIRSENKYAYANATGTIQEEYNETTSLLSTSGYWKVEVRNTTNSTINRDPFNVTAYIYVNTANWIASNYSTLTFNMTGRLNSSKDVRINFTIPNKTLDGDYEGFLQYKTNTSAAIQIPINLTVRTGTLEVNRTLNSTTITLNENIGSNATRTLKIPINNTGSNNLAFTVTNSSNNLTLVTNRNRFINLSFDNTTSLSANSNSLINITLNISNVTTQENQGLYEGWIYFNSTESRPYSGFNLSIRINLTNHLIAEVTKTITKGEDEVINDTTTTENVSIRFNLYYINGSSPIAVIPLTNITSVWLQEGNITDTFGRIPRSGSLNFTNLTSLYIADNYNISALIPANQVGGRYTVHIVVNYTRGDGFIFNAEGVNNSVIISKPGLNMTTTNSTSITLDRSTTSYVFVVNVSNYGPITTDIKNASIQFSESCAGWTVATPSIAGTGCSGTADGVRMNLTTVPGYNTNCTVSWTISNSTDVTTSACTGNIIGVHSHEWFDPTAINVSVAITGRTEAATGTTATGGGAGTTTTTPSAASVYLDILSYPSSISIVQGQSKSESVVVKNINTSISQTVYLFVEGIDSSWVSVSPSSATLSALTNQTFTVTFTIPSTAEIKDYSSKFKANSTYGSKTKDFTLKVTPTETTKTEINNTLAQYKVNATKLSGEINQSKTWGYNVTLAEAKLSELLAKIKQAENYIATGDYNSAYALFDSIKTLFTETRTELQNAKKGIIFPLPSNILTYVAIGAGIAISGFLAYLFWPTRTAPSPKLEKKTTEIKKQAENIFDKLKEKWSKKAKYKYKSSGE